MDSGQGGDSWSPVLDAFNEWIQIGGGGLWAFGELHTEIAGGIHGNPSWGLEEIEKPYKQRFVIVIFYYA